MLTTISLISMAGIVIFGLMAFIIGNHIRDVATHTKNLPLAETHYWVEFISKTSKVSNPILVPIIDKSTGEFEYKGRRYYAGHEHYSADYPPGRGRTALVTFQKVYADPSNADMATCLYGKPTVSSDLIGATVNQEDTKDAMLRSKEESEGLKKESKVLTYLGIGIAIVGVISLVSVIFIIKTGSENASLLDAINQTMSRLANTLGVH